MKIQYVATFGLITAVLMAAGCTKVSSRVAVNDVSTSFFVESTLSKPLLGGTATHVVEINIDNRRLAEQRPISVRDFNFVKSDDLSDDLAKLDGFLWYIPLDAKVLIGIGRRSLADDKSISPFVVGEFPAKKAER